MKMSLIIFFSFLNGILNSQNISYNVYEIGKGEILKNDYEYLELLNDTFLAATIKKEGVDYLYADLTGIINLEEDILLPFEYRNIQKIRDNFNLYKKEKPFLAAVSNGSGRALFKFENKAFNPVTDFKYLNFRPFLFDGNYLVCSNYQILNLENGEITKTNFLEIKPLTNNLAATKNKDYEWGIIDKNGTIILKNDFSKIYSYDKQFISIVKKDSIGVVNNKGEIIIPPLFSNIRYTESLILAQTFSNGEQFKINEKLIKKLSNWNVSLNKNDMESNILYSLKNTDFKQLGLYGAFNHYGELVIPFEYNLLEKGINEEVIAIKNNKFRIISGKGKKITDLKFNDIQVVFDTFYIVEENKNFNILIKNGKQLLKSNYKNVFPISDTEILYLENNYWHKISFSKDFSNSKTEKTDLTSEYTFQYFRSLSKESVNYFIVKKKGKFGVIDNKLNFIIACINPEANDFINNKYFDLGTLYTLIGKPLPGNIIVKDPNDKYPIICIKNNKYGAYDINGTEVIPFIYSELQHINGKKFLVSKEGKSLSINDYFNKVKEIF